MSFRILLATNLERQKLVALIKQINNSKKLQGILNNFSFDIIDSRFYTEVDLVKTESKNESSI